MGASGDLQFMIPFASIIILFRFLIVDCGKVKFKIACLGYIFVYTLLKIFMLKVFKYNNDFIDITIILSCVSLLFYYLKIYRPIKKKVEMAEKEELIVHINYIRRCSYVMFLFPIVIKVFNLSFLFGTSIKNFILLLIDYYIAGFILYCTSIYCGKSLE